MQTLPILTKLSVHLWNHYMIAATNPPHPPVTPRPDQLALAQTALASGDLDRAELLFRRIVATDPNAVSAWRGLAETQIGARRGMCLRWAEYADAIAQPRPTRQPALRAAPARRRPRATLLSAASAGLLALLVIGSDVAYSDRVLPGVVVAGVDVGGLPRQEAQAIVQRQHQQIAQRPFEARAGDAVWRGTLGNFFGDQSSQLVDQAFAHGHEPRFWARARSRFDALVGESYSVDAPAPNAAAIAAFADQIVTKARQERRDAQLVQTDNGWQIVPEQAGRRVDRAQAVEQITRWLVAQAAAETVAPLDVAVIEDAPRRTAAQLEPMWARMEELAAQPLALQLGDQQWTLDRSMLLTSSDATDPATLQPSAAAIAPYLAEVAAAVAVLPQASQLVMEGDRVRSIAWGQPGRELDQAATLDRVRQALQNGSPQVELAMREIAPPTGQAEQLGLLAELGRGESQFLTYSSPERDANVQVGGNDIDGVLLAPGEVFSFTQTVGSITWEKGYRWGEMIQGGGVVPSLGGGICQVSTTAFRAAFWSGLEIVERNAHSWRLPWYEVDAAPGMDAAIALGGPDLKFRNNTDGHILIKVETDLVNKRQTVILYGTPDGRKVAMQPISGGAIGIQRQVTQGAGVVTDETFMSYYSQ